MGESRRGWRGERGWEGESGRRGLTRLGLGGARGSPARPLGRNVGAGLGLGPAPYVSCPLRLARGFTASRAFHSKPGRWSGRWLVTRGASGCLRLRRLLCARVATIGGVPGRRHTGRRVREHRAANAACTTVEISHNASTPTSCATLDACPSTHHRPLLVGKQRIRSSPSIRPPLPAYGLELQPPLHPETTPPSRRSASWPGRRRSAGGRSAAVRRGVAQPRLRLGSHRLTAAVQNPVTATLGWRAHTSTNKDSSSIIHSNPTNACNYITSSSPISCCCCCCCNLLTDEERRCLLDYC
uniref:Uncharacterized protein n=1 Tax=Oryza meridionalis TaxID=40149 RepID=A0A0E0CQN0_9ORYZ